MHPRDGEGRRLLVAPPCQQLAANRMACGVATASSGGGGAVTQTICHAVRLSLRTSTLEVRQEAGRVDDEAHEDDDEEEEPAGARRIE